MIKDIKTAVAGHAQKYANSCATSLGELLLILEGEAPPDLQQHEKLVSTGLKFLKDQTYGSITFRQFDPEDRTALRTRIEQEIAAKRAVGVFLINPAPQTGVHAWAIVEIGTYQGKDTFFMVSKQSEDGAGSGAITIEGLIPFDAFATAPLTDVIGYERAIK